eukprot:1768197-Prymnesium_polylepis.1
MSYLTAPVSPLSLEMSYLRPGARFISPQSLLPRNTATTNVGRGPAEGTWRSEVSSQFFSDHKCVGSAAVGRAVRPGRAP